MTEVKRKKRKITPSTMETHKTVKKAKGKSKVGAIIGRVMTTIGATLLVVFITLYSAMWIFCHGPSTAARNLFVSTILETGALKFLAGWYFDKDEIVKITNSNSMGTIDDETDIGMIEIPTGGEDDPEQPQENEYHNNFDENGVEIVTVTGRTFMGKMMIVKNPEQVCVGTIYPWSDWKKSKNGQTLDVLVKNSGAIGGVNGGEYQSDGNWGGIPKGIVVCKGQIQYNAPYPGDVMVGFNTDNILVIKDIGGMTAAQLKQWIIENKIRDAVSFKDVENGDVNHFTKLIINGEARAIVGNGSGANPRTAIGQRKDGAVLILVTDGRGHEGHLGATAADLISVMQEFGAVNAANIDGGSSSSMYYNGQFEMTSVTLYFSTSSWNLPTAFVVNK